MSYSEKIQQSKQKVYSYAIATKILDLMDKLRLNNNGTSRRRWIWELLQNAKDVSAPENGVNVEIKLTKDGQTTHLDFSHNGLPFSIDNITFLVEQVSTKDRTSAEGEAPKTTGRFGTGFLTTHLLSEQVEVHGVVKEPDLSHRKFTLTLDRSGQNIEEITQSVENSLAMLISLDRQDDYNDYNPTALNTSFRYHLGDEGYNVALAGISDLHTAIPYTLIFNPRIQSVHIAHEGIIYVRGEVRQLNADIQLARIIKITPNGSQNHDLVVLSRNHVTIAREVKEKDGQFYLLPFDKHLPRLFCDFPLIGSEDLHFPVVVNSSFFYPTEPRDGIFLSDRNDARIEENKRLLHEGLVSLFSVLLQFVSENNWRNTFYLADIKTPQEKEWLSKSWFEDAIVKSARKLLLYVPLVDTAKGERVAIRPNEGPMLFFPSAPKKEIREKIWNLLIQWMPQSLPSKEDFQHWHEYIWQDCFQLTVKSISDSIQYWASLDKMIEITGLPDYENAIQYLNEYYDLLNYEGEFINQIINDTYAVIPNQLGKFRKRSQLFIDGGIEEELKNVLGILANDPRDDLKHQSVITKSNYGEGGPKITYYIRNQEYVIAEINKHLAGNNGKAGQAISYLTSLCSEDLNFPESRKVFYQFSKDILGDEIPERRFIQKWDNSIWEISDKLRLGRLSEEVSKMKNLSALSERLHFDEHQIILDWIDRFIRFLLQFNRSDLLNDKNAPILPNQNGEFRIKDDLFLDDGEIDETLKDIAASLGYDCRAELLDKNIFLELPANRTKTKQDIAYEIVQLIRPRLSEVPRSEETRKIFKSLFLWLNANKAEAELIFDDLYKNRHRLYDDEEIAENMKKAEMLDDILTEHDVTIEELTRLAKKHNLKDLIEKMEKEAQEKEPEPPKTPADIQAALIQLGITSHADLLRALRDKRIANHFEYISSGVVSVEMFEYVMELIERAKENVQAFLASHQDYDASGWHEESKTVIIGVKKFGRPVTIVVRPSDGGQVIFYYGAEKDALERVSAELWIDDGQNTPQHLTLGRIIKRNNITRIEV